MTDRHAGYVVTLECDIREDEAESTIAAIHHIKGVVSVAAIVDSPELHSARERARWEFLDKLYRFAKEVGAR